MTCNDKHHRKPRSIGGKNTDENISLVNKIQHRSWHNLFKNKTPQEIARLINTFWLDPDYEFICQEKPKKCTTLEEILAREG